MTDSWPAKNNDCVTLVKYLEIIINIFFKLRVYNGELKGMSQKICALEEPNIGMSHKCKSQTITIKYFGRKL